VLNKKQEKQALTNAHNDLNDFYRKRSPREPTSKTVDNSFTTATSKLNKSSSTFRHGSNPNS
jgi:hypothetical protein